MKNGAVLTHLVSQRNEASFERKKWNLIIRVLIISSVVIFSLETFLMAFLEFYLVLPELVVMILDGLILIIFLFPINYFLIVQPMSRQIEEHHHTNLELLKSNEILERFFSISDILIAYMDTDFNFLRVNQAYAATDQRPPPEFIGKNHFDLFPNEENLRIFRAVVATGTPYYAVEKPFEYAEHPERGVTYWDWSLLPVKNPDNQVVALILVLNNVTARKVAQLALLDSERRFRAVFNQTFQHSILLDPNGSVLLVNQTALDFSGLSPEAIVGQPLWQLPWWEPSPLSAPGVLDQFRDSVAQAAAGQVVRCEQWVRSHSGEKAIMDITIKPLLDETGATLLLIYEARDITPRIRAEEALKRSERQIKRLYLAEKSAHQFAETLRSAVLAVSGSLHSDTVLGTLLDHLLHVIPYTSAHILLLEDEENLVVRLARGEETWEAPDRIYGKRFELPSQLFFHPLFERNEILFVPDTLLYPGAVFLPIDQHVRCWLGIPLLAGEQIVGVCMLEHMCPGFFTQEQIHWATALTGQAAVSIQNAWLFEQVRDGREHLQALSRQLVEAQEHERHYIARELHDEAGQALASLMIGLRHLEHDSHNQKAVLAHIQELKQIADNVLEDLHRLAIDLRPAILDHLGLVAALRQHAERVSDLHSLVVQFESGGNIPRLPGEIETAIYRIVQETLTNVVRHSQATRVDILLDRREDRLVVVVEDNGIGFDPHISRGGHLGVIGMRERADMLGGTLVVESSPGQGATILLEVPCLFES